MKRIISLLLMLVTFMLTGCMGMGEDLSQNQPQQQQTQQQQVEQNQKDINKSVPEGNNTNNKNKAEIIDLNVAAAASLTDVMKELEAMYRRECPNVIIAFNFGSSGALQQAIENGGQTDLFYSAGKKQMDALDNKDLLAKGTRRDLLVNEVALIVSAQDGPEITSFNDLTAKDIRKIAIGGSGVPVGQYTEEVFKNLNINDQVEHKEVLATDVRQVLAWVAAGEVDAGVVYTTDAAISKDVKVICKAPQGSHKAIVYPAAVLKDTKNLEAAKEFLEFTASDKAKAVFEKYGFTVK